MLNRRTVGLALATVGAATALAVVMQLALLGALRAGPDIDQLALQPAANVVVAGVNSPSLRFDASSGPAVAQSRAIDLRASDVLALALSLPEGGGPARLALGWRVAEDSRHAASTGVRLVAGNSPREAVVPVVGHPRWRGRVMQVALALEPGFPVSLTVDTVAIVPANPLGGTRLLLLAWFGERDTLLTAEGAAVRVLPLAFWIAFVAVTSIGFVALRWRRQPAKRAQALLAVALVVALLAVLLTVIGNRWPGWTPALMGSAATAACLLLAGAALPNPKPPLARWHLRLAALAAFAAGAAMSPVVAAVAAVPLIILLTATVAPAWISTLASLLAILPPLAIAAAAQHLITLPAIFAPLVDPTATLLTIANSASGMPGFALGLVAVHRLWPAPAMAQRWAAAPGAATAWAVTGAVCVLSVPRLAVLARDSSAFVGLLLPALSCLALAMAPRFRAVAATAADAFGSGAEKTEADLSANALMLLESHAERVRLNLERGENGNAHQALRQMQLLAPAARMTTVASLRIALADNDTDAAATAASRLRQRGELSESDSDLLLEQAHRQGEHKLVIELAPHASRTPGNARAVARAFLLDDRADGRRAALQALRHCDRADQLARDIAEIALLLDDVPAAQQALEMSGIPLLSPAGEAYIARLGMRVQGAAAYADGVGKLATWQPQLGVAHAALGELMLRQGNRVGSGARFVLAMKLDSALWPLQWHVNAMSSPAPEAATESASPSAAAMT